MTSTVERIVPLAAVSCLKFDWMAIDLWRVEAGQGAGGRYVSPDPRFVMLFDGAQIALSPAEGAVSALCSAFFVPAGMALCGRLAAAGDLEHIDIHVDADRLRALVGPQVSLDQALFLPDSIELRRLCALLADECRRPERPAGYGEALACGVIHEFFHLGAQLSAARATPAWLDEVMDHVRGRLDRHPSVEELASLAGMSRSRFTRRFKELAGMPPHQWVMGTRIKQAQRLLSEGAMLSQVAHDTGFADQAHFSRCFRHATGMSPGRWTKRHECSKAGAFVQDSRTARP
ncbi:AraC family transcriptional regulator [Thalassobaculum sp. OXR-137]|uniref:helix-turn-helix domain-containing protein n=1 Tax=Thalassobaculum sp. OXR-137 TaxID=3100173 RepID=UPI002AC8F84C|nr:AraC family transcriptional regulator [Thalassobaculum sp. OXR-137]WPZ34003.1 AraC family transcriptional regulator [Thalassobaculum sp. OXR-137]